MTRVQDLRKEAALMWRVAVRPAGRDPLLPLTIPREGQRGSRTNYSANGKTPTNVNGAVRPGRKKGRAG